MRKNEDNPRKCRNFISCSQNFCPLDLDLNLRSGRKQDRCRFMREPKPASIHGRKFVSGGGVMPDALLNFVSGSNLKRLNTRSQARHNELNTNN